MPGIADYTTAETLYSSRPPPPSHTPLTKDKSKTSIVSRIKILWIKGEGVVLEFHVIEKLSVDFYLSKTPFPCPEVGRFSSLTLVYMHNPDFRAG